MANDDDAPWLAAAERPGIKPDRGPLVRLIAILTVIAALAILAVFVLLRPGQGSDEGYMEAAQAPLISAEPGPFKVKPEDPRGLDVQGQDQTIYAAGTGNAQDGDINLGALPEEPMARPGTTPPATPAQDLLPPAMQTGPAPKPAPALPKATLPTPPFIAPKPPPPAPIAAPGRTVQLGAFSTRERAEAAWARLAARPGMAGFTPRYASVSRDGQTLWRLRASGGDAAALCARLSAASETCTVVTE